VALVDLANMKVLATYPVGKDPDVLAFDTGLKLLYVSAESGRTDPEVLIDALNGPLFFRWLQGHAPLERSFAERIFDRVILGFQR
jgi:hypothetical protein